MRLGLGDKVAIVTGGTRGIGEACAKALIAEECRVVVAARRQPDWKQSGRLAFVQWDATLPGDGKRIVDRCLELWGPPTILVNNVGGGGRRPAADLFADRNMGRWWETVMRRNLGAMQELTDLCLPFMRQAGWGRVVTVASIHGREAGGRPWFAAAKAAEIAAMKAYAVDPENARAGVTCNVVAPGCVEIPGTGWEPGMEATTAKAATVPMGRLGRPEEVAAVVAFLCSNAAAWVNGACWVVDGGEGRAF